MPPDWPPHQLAVIRGLVYTDASQVFNRWLVPGYQAAFSWTGNRVDSEDTTAWALHAVADRLQLPELVQSVDEQVADTILEGVARHWSDRYGIDAARCGGIYLSKANTALQRRTTLDSLFSGLTTEMRLVLVLRFLRRRAPAEIGAQLRIRPDAARRQVIAALSIVAEQIGFASSTDWEVQVDHLSAYVDDVIHRRRPVRFEAQPAAWPAMIGAGHVQAAIAGNDIPAHEFIESVERLLRPKTRRRFVTEPRMWSA